MTPTTQIVRPTIPKAVWMPAPLRADMPDCYQGSPLEMVQQMATDMQPNLGVHEAIDILLQSLADERGIRIDLDAPADTPEAVRSGMFVYALILVGVAEEMPAA